VTTDEFQRNRENFCYRHPDRQSFVLCQRCLRTICPECQTPAAVGVMCPECLRDQQKGQSPAQRKAERRWSRPRALSARSGQPVVTYSIIGITAFVFLLQLIPGFGSLVTDALLFAPPYLYPAWFGVFEPWRALTALLVHDASRFFHIALNMLALWMLGRSLEPLLGRGRFLTLYLLSGLGGSVAVVFLGFDTAVVGASGAIYGLFGALLIIGRHIGANIRGIVVVLGINLVITFLPLITGGRVMISWQAHLGGFLVGMLVAFIITRTRAVRQRGLQIGLLVAVGGGLIGLLFVPALFPALVIG
jgi:membrane associated rhomboid family serine protease